ncbi:MAG: hypothetical protein MUE60_14105, partial [Candidatus Eisenbacteria bacterium]|nr:hypothetical protein [Candidatus Eisenbacteria bacterium]
FGSLSADNARIITMEWVVEGVALICLGGTLAAVTSVDHAGRAATVVYATPGASLVALAVVSLFTGFTISFIPFKLCPAIRPSSAVLMLLGTLP